MKAISFSKKKRKKKSKLYAWCVWKQWEIWLQKCKMDKENNAMHVLICMCNAWKDWSVKNLKTKNFPISIGRTSIEYQSREAESFAHKSSHFWSVEGDLRLVETIKNFRTLKSWNFMEKNNLKGVFTTQCRWTWSRKVLKTWCLLNSNIKTNEEVKTTRFKLLNFFFKNSQPNKNFVFAHQFICNYKWPD